MPVFAHPEWNAITNVSGNNIDTEGESGYNDDTLNADEYRAEGGGIYGEQGNSDSEVLGGRTVSTAGGSGNNQWSQSENTQKLFGWLGNRKIGSTSHEGARVGSNSWIGESQGATANRLRHGEGVFGNLSRVTLKETDSAGRVLSEQLRNELSETAMKDGNAIIPVQFEVKQYIDDNNRLYLAVALTKIETGVMGDTASENQMRTRLLPVSDISISDLFNLVNQYDSELKPNPVNEALIENGKPKTLYHQTESEFTEFDITRQGAGAL